MVQYMKKRKILRLIVLFNIVLLSTILFACSSKSEEDNCSHDFTQWKSSTATCTTDGVKTRQCVVCKKVESEFVPKTGHSFTEYSPDGNATCKAVGTKTAVCNNGCGSVDVITAFKNPAVHESIEVIYEVNSINSQYHDVKYACCQALKETVLHEYTNYISNNDATCYKDGSKTATCVCGKRDTVTDLGSKLKHTGGIATCSKKAICSLCKYPYGDYDKDNHTKSPVYSISYTQPNSHHIKYNCCNSYVVEEHKFIEFTHNSDATCIKNATEISICSICGLADCVRELPNTATGQHDYDIVEHLDATCTEVGYDKFKCKTCPDEKLQEISILDHAYEQVPYQTGSCSQLKIDGKKCVVCGDFKGIKAPLYHEMIFNGEEFVCKHCNYESLTDGENDSVIIELIEDEDNFIIGYYNIENPSLYKIDGVYELRVIYFDSKTNRNTFKILQVVGVDDGVSKIYFSKEEVAVKLKELNIVEYDLRYILKENNGSSLYIDLVN